MKPPWTIKIIENIQEMHLVEEIQRRVWQERETDIVPAHLMNSAVHNGGLLLGAFTDHGPVGFVFGFSGFYTTPDGPRLKHYSSMLGVLPEWRNQGMGFALKRAQWQLVRYQGIDRITWTFDPLLSRNAWLNITRLGAVCSTYRRDFYGKMIDMLNQGLPTDRFDVDWWVNSPRVNRRLSRRRRNDLTLVHYLSGGAQIYNPAEMDVRHLPQPVDNQAVQIGIELPFLLVEIPDDFQALKAADIQLASDWRMHSRVIFEALFTAGYIVTDFVRSMDEVHSMDEVRSSDEVRSTNVPTRSYYVLCHGESTL